MLIKLTTIIGVSMAAVLASTDYIPDKYEAGKPIHPLMQNAD